MVVNVNHQIFLKHANTLENGIVLKMNEQQDKPTNINNGDAHMNHSLVSVDIRKRFVGTHSIGFSEKKLMNNKINK